MFLHGYFYWSGIVFNAIALFWLVVGMVTVGRNWSAEKRVSQHYAVKNLEEEDGENHE